MFNKMREIICIAIAIDNGLQALLVLRILHPSKADSALFEAVIEMFSTQLYKDAGIVVVRLDPDHDLTNWCLGNQFIIHRHHPP